MTNSPLVKCLHTLRWPYYLGNYVRSNSLKITSKGTLKISNTRTVTTKGYILVLKHC